MVKQMIELRLAILEILKRERAMTDRELLNELQKSDSTITYRDLQRELFYLEISGLVHVSRATKSEKRVELYDEKAAAAIGDFDF